jgi:peptidyl-prolyl cis-trans isomerase D
MIEQKVREEKKAELIAKKYAGKGLDAIAAESMQQVMQSDSVILGGSYVPNLGYEPKVVGYAFNKTLQPNTVSPAIKGQAGVYFISVLSRNESPLPPDGGMMDQILAQQRMQQERQMRSVIDQTLQQAMIKRTNVEYHPDNF